MCDTCRYLCVILCSCLPLPTVLDLSRVFFPVSISVYCVRHNEWQRNQRNLRIVPAQYYIGIRSVIQDDHARRYRRSHRPAAAGWDTIPRALTRPNTAGRSARSRGRCCSYARTEGALATNALAPAQSAMQGAPGPLPNSSTGQLRTMATEALRQGTTKPQRRRSTGHLPKFSW